MSPDDHIDDDEVESRSYLAASSGLTIIEPDPEEDDEADLEDEPLVVLITGACGNIGTKLRAAWSEVYDLVLLDVAAPANDPGPGASQPKGVVRAPATTTRRVE